MNKLQKSIAALLLVVGLSACGADNVRIKTLEANLALAKMTMDTNRETQSRYEARQKDIELARIAVQKAEADAKLAKYGAISLIGQKADAVGKGVALAMLAGSGEQSRQDFSMNQVVQAPTLLQIPQLPTPRSTMDEVKDWVGLASAFVNPAAQTLMALKGFKSNEIINRQNNEAQTTQQGNLMNAFGQFSANQTTLGVAAVDAGARVGVEQARNPGVLVSGNGNAVGVNGSNASITNTTITNTNDCPNNTTAQSGNTGNAAPGGAGGAASVGAPGTSTAGNGAPSGASGNTGTAQPNGTVNCTAGEKK
jgi:hypothetical protein